MKACDEKKQLLFMLKVRRDIMNNRFHRIVTAFLSLCLVLTMSAVSVFAYTPDELREIVSKAMNVAQKTNADGSKTYSDDSVDKILETVLSLSSALKNATADNIITAEEQADLDAKADAVKAACDAVVLRTTIKMSNTKKTFKASALKKKAVSFTLKAKTNSGAKATFKKDYDYGNKRIKVSKNGKITVRKGTKKGTYEMDVKVSVPSTTLNGVKTEAASEVVTVKVKVK